MFSQRQRPYDLASIWLDNQGKTILHVTSWALRDIMAAKNFVNNYKVVLGEIRTI